MKTFIVKLVDVQTGEFDYVEGQADNSAEAVDLVFEMIPEDMFRLEKVFMSVDDVHEHYNVRTLQ